MTVPTADRQRQLRRRHRHERQAVIFGALIAALTLAGLGAVAVYTGAIASPFQRDFTSPSAEPTAAGAIPPCPAEGTLPVPYAEVGVRVFNGTQTPGLAGQTARDLEARGLAITGTDNYPADYPGVAQIGFGATGLAAAYTLGAHFEAPEYVLDLRQDASVDLVVGGLYTTPLDPTLVLLDPAAPMTGPTACIPLDQAMASARPAPATTEAPPADGEVDPGEGEPVQTEPPAEG